MKLIAESGSTRTEWALVEDNRLIQRAFTEGLNPFFQTRREISRSVRLGLPEHFFKRKLEQVYYYGAGCTSYEKKNVLGKMFLSDVLKGLAPKDVTADFFEKFRISPNEVMESVYNRPFPNRFLSTISYFLADYTNDDYVFELITGNLRNFFTRNVCQYDYKNYPIRFVGSLAYSYATILREVAREFGIELEIIEETPMNGLIEFHSLNIEEP